ncbi:MAG: hypothetical protein V3U03_02475, partial [Myxococcota bacterium]
MNPSGGSPLRAPAWAVPLTLALYSGFALRDFLGEGLPIFFDAHSHLARSWFTARAFAAGH